MTDRFSVWDPCPPQWGYDDEDYNLQVDEDAEAYVNEFDFVPPDDDYEPDDTDRELLFGRAQEYLQTADWIQR